MVKKTNSQDGLSFGVPEKNCSTNSKLLRFVVDIKHRFALAATPRVLMVTISRTGY
jgi:hypothetical protein